MWGPFLSGFTVEDTHRIEVTELSGYDLLVPRPMQLKTWLFGKQEDLIVFSDIQIDIGGPAVSDDARNGEGLVVGDIGYRDHGQVNHGICRKGKKSFLTLSCHFSFLWKSSTSIH